MAVTEQQILDVLAEAGRPLSRRRLSHHFGMDKERSDAELRPVLMKLVGEGRLVKNRRAAYGLPDHMDLIKGRISAHPDGFGFVIPDAGGDDLFLPPKAMRTVMHGDRVLAAVASVDRRGRKEGMLVEVLERAHQRVVGRFVLESGVAVVVPDDPRLSQDILIPLEDAAQAKPGQIVVAQLTEAPTAVRSPVGRIVAVLGGADEPGMATEIAIHSHQLPFEFPGEVVQAAERYGDTIPEAAIEGRRDYRDLPLVTIDGADARDFDDAVYAHPTKSGFRLVVAIADVAEYVRPGQPLDDEAVKRGTSVYFPDRVIPMLPEALSNGLCSLRPDEDRLCMTCEMRIDAKGKVTDAKFFEGVMRSRARLTYDQVRAMLDDGDPELRRRHEAVLDNLESLNKVYHLFRKRRERRGAMNFDSREVYFRFAEDGRVADIVPYARHDAHKLIEECMITANVEAAKFVEKSGLPALYRVHDSPPAEKLEDLKTFLSAHGLKVSWKDEPTPQDLARIQERATGMREASLVDAVLLRSMALAVYQPKNTGHFGLALDAYAHFTSPIRRYPDLLLHRALKHRLRRGQHGDYPYSPPRMAELGEHCSWTERRAEEASRDVDERLKCQFMQRHIGDEFDGIITGVTSFGLFVELDGLGVSGLVHVTALSNDYYHFDSVARSLTGERRGKRYRLADAIRVRLAAVNPGDRKIDFQIAGEPDS